MVAAMPGFQRRLVAAFVASFVLGAPFAPPRGSAADAPASAAFVRFTERVTAQDLGAAVGAFVQDPLVTGTQGGVFAHRGQTAVAAWTRQLVANRSAFDSVRCREDGAVAEGHESATCNARLINTYLRHGGAPPLVAEVRVWTLGGRIATLEITVDPASLASAEASVAASAAATSTAALGLIQQQALAASTATAIVPRATLPDTQQRTTAPAALGAVVASALLLAVAVFSAVKRPTSA
jgi:hypothetical protein